MNFLDGYKSWIGLGGGALTAALVLFGVIDGEQAAWAGTVFAAVFGVGVTHKFTKGQDLTKQVLDAIRDKAVVLLALGFGCTFFFASSPAVAVECDFDNKVDAKIIRLAWPPAVGVNALGFIDFEAGVLDKGQRYCGTVDVNAVGGFCLIPKVKDLIGGLCPEAE